MAKEKFIQKMHMKKGALHKSLHVPEGKKIPESKIKKAEHSKSPKLRKRAVLAETLKGMHHGKKHEAKKHSKKEYSEDYKHMMKHAR